MAMRIALVVLLFAFVVGGGAFFIVYFHSDRPNRGKPLFGDDTETVERTDVNPPPPNSDEQFTDDAPNASKPLKFDPNRVHSTPAGDWQVNLSATYTRLD